MSHQCRECNGFGLEYQYQLHVGNVRIPLLSYSAHNAPKMQASVASLWKQLSRARCHPNWHMLLALSSAPVSRQCRMQCNATLQRSAPG